MAVRNADLVGEESDVVAIEGETPRIADGAGAPRYPAASLQRLARARRVNQAYAFGGVFNQTRQDVERVGRSVSGIVDGEVEGAIGCRLPQGNEQVDVVGRDLAQIERRGSRRKKLRRAHGRLDRHVGTITIAVFEIL